MTYFLYNEHHITIKKIMFPMKMTILCYAIMLIRFIIFSTLFLYISYFILCHLWVPRDVYMFFILTPVLLYM